MFLIPQAPAPPPQPAAVYRIPYRLSDSKHIIVRVKINGKGPFSFILDTGSPAFIASTVIAQKAALPESDEPVRIASTADIEGGLSLKDVKIRVMDPFQLKHMNSMGLADADIAGVLGYSLLARYRIDIDLKRRHMLWTDSGVEPEMPTREEVTGGKPIRPGAEVGELDSIAGSARRFFPPKDTRPARGRGFIGMELKDSPAGIRVSGVLPGTPASRAAILPGDLVLRASAGGEAEPIERAEQLVELAAGLPGGKRLFLELKRGARRFKVALTADRAAL